MLRLMKIPLRATVGSALAIAALVMTSAAPLQAQSHRARLSRDVADRLAQRIEAATEVIVSAPADRIDAVAARYGAVLKKKIYGGAVLQATGGQIDALSQDPDVAHIAGNATVFRMMAVTT